MKQCKLQLKEYQISRSLSKIDTLAQKKSFTVDTFDLENINDKTIIDKVDSKQSEDDEESSESFMSNESYYSIHSNDKCEDSSHNHKFNKKNSLSS